MIFLTYTYLFSYIRTLAEIEFVFRNTQSAYVMRAERSDGETTSRLCLNFVKGPTSGRP